MSNVEANPAKTSPVTVPAPLPPGRQFIILLVLVLAVLAVVGAVVLLPRLFTHEAEDQTETAATPGVFRATDEQWAGLKIAEIKAETFRTEVTTDGEIAVDDDTTTPVFSPYTGRVTKLLAKVGDNVVQGAPLFAVQASEFAQAQNDLIAAVGTLKTAQAQLTLAHTNEQRQHDLFDAKGGALKDWQQSQSDLATAQNGFRSAQIALGLVRNRLRILGKSDDEISALENSPDGQDLDAETVVSAPIAGTVTQRQVGVGQYLNSVAGGATNQVFTIGDLSTVWLEGNVREADAPQMHVGEPVEVTVLAYPDRIFKAKLSYVAPSIDPNTHRLLVRAEMENTDGALKPQMFANFKIITSDDTLEPAVPEEAVVYEGDKAHVWVAANDKSLALREIRVGRAIDGDLEVLSGLAVSEKVVTSGSLFIDRAAKAE
jgi:membrane fusion protein, heavy metal efflux system